MSRALHIPKLAPALQEAIEASRLRHGLEPSEIYLCLLFGSNAKGTANPGSDVDLIFLVRDSTGKKFAFIRNTDSNPGVDSNVVPFSALDSLCRIDVDWAYRLYHAQPVMQFSNCDSKNAEMWLIHTNKLIESYEACRFRCDAHLSVVTKLSRLLMEMAQLPCLTFYLASEVVHLLPLALLSAMRRIPFRTRYPGDEAREILSEVPLQVRNKYQTFAESVSAAGIFLSERTLYWNSALLKKTRSKLRRMLQRFDENILSNGYDGLLEEVSLSGHEIERYFEDNASPTTTIPEGFIRELNALTRSIDTLNNESRGSLPVFKKEKTIIRQSGVRLVEVSEDGSRLKIILPTSGCRVPTCTFCMLPTLARKKGNIASVMRQVQAEMNARFPRVSIQTDGSFFDDRELSDNERTTVLQAVKRLGALELIVDSLPRFVTAEKMSKMSKDLGNCSLTISFGLQSSDDGIRRFITRTPVRLEELNQLLLLRQTWKFKIRVYLLAGKWLMSRSEDLSDVVRSCRVLHDLLGPNDIVTVNPLLPTEGTPVAMLERDGFFNPMDAAGANHLATALLREKWNFKLEFGPLYESPCTTRYVGHGANRFPYASDRDLLSPELDSGMLPWSVLGDWRERYYWAVGGSVSSES